MDKIKLFVEWLKTLPIWLRAIALLAIGALALIASMSLSACGTTKVVVRNGADSTRTQVSVTTNNPTSVETSPKVELTFSLDSLVNLNNKKNGN